MSTISALRYVNGDRTLLARTYLYPQTLHEKRSWSFPEIGNLACPPHQAHEEHDRGGRHRRDVQVLHGSRPREYHRPKRGRDPEALHELRVGVRRLRAALSVFREAIAPAQRCTVARALRRFERNLGPARH